MKSIYFVSSILAAHASSGGDGFRQKEVRFYMDLFSNWVFVNIDSEPFPLHNTQIMRSLENLVRLGLVKKSARNSPPRYKLTQAGLVKLVKDLLELPLSNCYSEFFFVYQFIVNQKAEIIAASKTPGSMISSMAAVEVESLLNSRKYLAHQLELVNREIKVLKSKMNACESVIEKTWSLHRKNWDLPKILKQLDVINPYQMSTKKRLRQVFRKLPEAEHLKQLTDANYNRLHFFWKPKIQHLEAFGQILNKLLMTKPAVLNKGYLSMKSQKN